MNDMELYDKGREVSIPHEVEITEIEPIERAGYTRIENFAASEITDNKEIVEFIRNTLPLEHLENCPSITYHEDFCPGSPRTLGDFSLDSYEIRIWGLCNTPELIQKTISHEIGHNAYFNHIEMNSELANIWAELSEKGNFVSEYAREVSQTMPERYVYEDFAESYQLYINFPEQLAFIDPAKFEFMRDKVFGGREYFSQMPQSASSMAA
jgi:hypothetical protein